MHTPRTRRAFLCSRTALIRLFYSDRRLRGRSPLRRNSCGGLNHERWSFTSPPTANQYSEQQNPNRHTRSLQHVRFTKLRRTLVTESATGPYTPSQTHDPLATLG